MIFLLIFISFSFYKILQNNYASLLTLFLISTLFNNFTFDYSGLSIKVQYLLFIFLFLSIFINEFKKTNTFRILFDIKFIFIFYVLFSSLIVRILYPEMIVWPVGKAAIGTVVSELDMHLVYLKENNNLFLQLLFIIYPTLFFILISKLDSEIVLNSLNIYIKSIIIISLINIIIYGILLISPNLIYFFDDFFDFIFGNNFNYRYGTSSNISNSHRISFFIGEPSFMAIYIIPIMIFIYLSNFFNNKTYLIYFFILLFNLFLCRSTSGIISFFAILILIFLFKFKFKINILSFFKFFFLVLILIVIFNSFIFEYYQYTTAKFNDPQSSIWARYWSIDHSFSMFLQSPFFGSGVGTSIATSGFIVAITSFGLIGTFLFFKMINMKRLILSIFHNNDKYLFALAMTVFSILIANFFAGDITSIISPINFLFISIFTRRYFDLFR